MARILQLADSSSPSRFICKVSDRDGVFLGPIHSAQIYIAYSFRYAEQLRAKYRDMEFDVVDMPIKELEARIRSSERQYEIPESVQRKLSQYKE